MDKSEGKLYRFIFYVNQHGLDTFIEYRKYKTVISSYSEGGVQVFLGR